MQLNLLEEKTANAKMQRLIALMSRPEGSTNWELNKVLFRYGSYIHRLRNLGYLIETTYLKKGFYSYRITGKM